MGVIKRSKFLHVSPLETGPILPESDSLPELAPLENPTPAEALTQQTQHQLPPFRVSRPTSCFPKTLVGKSRSSRKSESGQDKIPKGQKKQRRYENNKFLLNLAESDEDKRAEPGFTEPHSVFTILLQEPEKMGAWNSFLSLSEDDQLAIIANNEIFAYFNNEPVLDQVPLAAVEKIVSYRERRRNMTAEEAFCTLCPKLKSIFTKRHFPMGMLAQLENEVLDFFMDAPQGTCVIERQCSFDRLILHAITQFNFLCSQSFTSEKNRRMTHIRNICPDFIPPPVSLSEYIRKKRC